MTESEHKQAHGDAKHKEELPGRINSDAVDRDKLRVKVDTVIDPLDAGGHPKGSPINIVTGKLAHPAVNVHHSLHLARVSREAYEKNLPTGFHDTINAGVKTMAYTGSRPNASSKLVTNPNSIINRALPMLSSGDIDLPAMFATELSEVVTSLFQANGDIRTATDKSKLMQGLASFKSYRTIPNPDTVIIDGVAMLWAIYWPVDGRVRDLVSGVAIYLGRQFTPSVKGVHLIFDRYREFSIKGGTRAARAQGMTRTTDDAGDTNSTEFMLTLDSPLPPQSVSLKVTENKVQLISIITDNIWEDVKVYISPHQHIIVSGPNDIPMKLTAASPEPEDCEDLCNSHEEADTIIIHHVVESASKNAASTIHVRCNDTDVFVLLCHFKHALKIAANIFMVPLSHKMKPIDINQTVIERKNIIPHLLSMHVITGCDTVSKPHGIGKTRGLTSLKSGHFPPPLGDLSVSHEDLVKKGTSFIGVCYGNPSSLTSMSEHRFQKWKNMTKGKSQIFKLETLPPTTEAFSLHIRRAHYQAAVWRAAANPDVPDMDPSQYGWEKDLITRTFVPIKLPLNTPIAPDGLLKILCCNCDSEESCKTRRCSCHKNNTGCGTFCKCEETDRVCHNPFTRKSTEDEDDDQSTNENTGDESEDEGEPDVCA
eukprot:TRINITY_DN51469_c0_g2_i2.p1 TRINITY_DN51469_c0_g2~~TRINITY_DN51469_c0_g2_i2.p1  ORF type:complete len:652 (+),score=127.59 TRINITY_DN51469_c0_g2_i2:129-2084(+)